MIQTLLKRLMKIDQESDKDMQQQTAGKNLFNKLLDKILEMILMNVTNSHAIDAFCSISWTYKRFQSVIEGKKRNTTDGSYRFFRECFPKSAKTSQQNKIECEKIIKILWFLQWRNWMRYQSYWKKLWLSAWLLIAERKHNCFIIELAFWKQRQNIQSGNLLQQSDIIDEVTEEP